MMRSKMFAALVVFALIGFAAPASAQSVSKPQIAADMATTTPSVTSDDPKPSKDWKKDLQSKLEADYPVTKIKFTNLTRQINPDEPHGVVLVTQQSGLRIDRAENQPTNTIDENGKLHGPGLGEMISIGNRAIHDDGTYDPATDGKMNTGERLYVTKIGVGAQEIYLTVQTVKQYSYTMGIKANEHSPVNPHSQRETKQFVALLQFKFPRSVIESGNMDVIKATINKYLVDMNNEQAYKSSEADLTNKTIAEVIKMIGDPTRKITVGNKTTYFYPQMKVVFVDGKVTDIQ